MKTCYVCDIKTSELSPRSRCVNCEYNRSISNENENEFLRSKVLNLQHEIERLTGHKPEDTEWANVHIEYDGGNWIVFNEFGLEESRHSSYLQSVIALIEYEQRVRRLCT